MPAKTVGADDKRYRERVYENYLSTLAEARPIQSAADLRPRMPFLTQLVRQHFPADRDAMVLELGCGHGALLYAAKAAGYTNLRGIDRSPEQIAAAQRLGVPGVEMGDAVEVLAASAAEAYDVVICFDVIEHFDKNEIIDFVDEVQRVLRPGGRWIVHVPNAESPFGFHMWHYDFTHELAFTRNSLSQLLLSSGFAEVRCFEDVPPVHGAKSAVRWLLWQVFRFGLFTFVAAETGRTGRMVFSQNMLAVATKAAA